MLHRLAKFVAVLLLIAFASGAFLGFFWSFRAHAKRVEREFFGMER